MTRDQFSRLLARHGLTQAEVARWLDLDARTVRRYVAGDQPVPKVVEYALQWLLVQRKGAKS